MTSPGGLSAETAARAAELVALYPQARSALVPICHLAQASDGYLSRGAMADIAELVGVTPAEVLGTASFYDMLHTQPVGRYLVGICTNVACLLSGGEELLGHAEERLGVGAGGTTIDGTFTLEELECVAACDRAPCATVNWRFFGPLTNEGFDTLMDELASGHLDEQVPQHGTLNRVRREVGLTVSREKVAAERARQDRSRAARKQSAEAVEAARAELDKAHQTHAPKAEGEAK
ncbi:MAG: NADH-quinone oxidoreductase subunit NuoE [Acidimicrobiales bacterium]